MTFDLGDWIALGIVAAIIGGMRLFIYVAQQVDKEREQQKK